MGEAGIVAWADGRSEPRRPSAGERVHHVLRWIRQGGGDAWTDKGPNP